MRGIINDIKTEGVLTDIKAGPDGCYIEVVRRIEIKGRINEAGNVRGIINEIKRKGF